MSRISDAALAGVVLSCAAALSMSVATTTAIAQEAPVTSIHSGNAEELSALRASIREQMNNLATELREGSSADNEHLTIEDLDELNRKAERARSRLDLEQARQERMQAQLQGLLSLYQALEALDPSPPSETPDATQEVEEVEEAQVEAPEPDEMLGMAADLETSKMPRLETIMGSDGWFSASVISTDGSRSRVEAGDFLADGFEVIDIQPKYLILRGEVTGSTYKIMPRSMPSSMSGSSPSALSPPSTNGTPQDAVDLGGLPISVF